MTRMSISFVFVCISLSSLFSTTLSDSYVSIGYEIRHFTQLVDHFNYNPQSYETFEQRYLINNDNWGGAENKAPIFVFIGGEADVEWYTVNSGFIFDIAPEFKALVVCVEHRYYGKSFPFGGNDIRTMNSSTLAYLTSTQALADLAVLITDLKTNLKAIDSPVIVFGGSYAGMLAAWLRLKYPHITIGALSSSAPILNFEGLTDPHFYTKTLTQDYRNVSENCYKVIKGSWQVIEDTAKQPGGIEILHKAFKTCTNNFTAADLERWLGAAIDITAMIDFPTPSNFLVPLPAYPIRQMCKAVDDPRLADDTLAKVYGAANIFYNYSGTSTCNDVTAKFVPPGSGGFKFQRCTEMVLPDASDENSIIPVYQWNYTKVVEECKARFNTVPRPNWITTHFGGHNIERVLKRFGSNIIFSNGMRDPWSGAGVLKNISESIVAVIAQEASHHVDLRSTTKEDPQWLTDMRKQEVTIMKKWISEYQHDLGLPSP